LYVAVVIQQLFGPDAGREAQRVVGGVVLEEVDLAIQRARGRIRLLFRK
jgi:hypothetical protein